MTLDEAHKLARIVSTADGGCWNFVNALIDRLNDEFPQFVCRGGDGGPEQTVTLWRKQMNKMNNVKIVACMFMVIWYVPRLVK